MHQVKVRKTKKNAKNFAPRHRARHWRATRKNSRYPYLASLKEEEAAALIFTNSPTSSTYEAEIWYGVSTAYGLALCKSWARLEPISKSYARNKFYIVFLKENHPKFCDFRPTFFRQKNVSPCFFSTGFARSRRKLVVPEEKMQKFAETEQNGPLQVGHFQI